MPVQFDSTSSGHLLVGSGTTSGDIEREHNVSTQARDRVLAAMWMLWTGEADTTGATFAGEFGGQPMVEHEAVRFDSDKCYFGVHVLEDAPRGSQGWVASFSSMPTEFLSTRNFMAITETYSGYEELAAAISAVGGSTLNNTVTVPSVRPAHRVLSGHAVGKLRGFTKDGYTLTKRKSETMLGGGALLVGDAPGDESVVATAVHNAASANWGAIGFALTPSIVEIGVTLKIPVRLRASIMAHREFIEPHPDREYIVPPVGSADPRMLAGNFRVSNDGVAMPQWNKDLDDTLEYTLHWQNHLADDDEIVHVEHTTEGSLRVRFEAFRPNATQVWLSGGSITRNHPVRVRLTTKLGRRHDRTFWIAGVSN
ncbi:hypothetical protein [Mycobacterium sp. NAZ190054]|uniref:phage fiber-tail adaptor protein n=1 Tax=Mycobacterium sp. NAZ190054 TaxID=1747766 RepID=UPI00079BC8C1|nr:hypothetical protein [Mycobacterium sp. NAZ190054]KWX67076.1 hypothetical protein ASJ79_23090 [Mycobacterium sp. NAZ190054]